MGLDKKVKMFSSSASLESIDPGDIQGAAEGVYFFENFPRMLAHKNDEYHMELNKLIGIDDMPLHGHPGLLHPGRGPRPGLLHALAGGHDPIHALVRCRLERGH